MMHYHNLVSSCLEATGPKIQQKEDVTMQNMTRCALYCHMSRCCTKITRNRKIADLKNQRQTAKPQTNMFKCNKCDLTSDLQKRVELIRLHEKQLIRKPLPPI